MTRDLGARYPRDRVHAPDGFVRDAVGIDHPLPDLPPRKENRPCCVARRDKLGRLPIGRCSLGCLGDPTNWQAHLRSTA